MSSFGIGGSNAHVVMVEAPNQSPTESERPGALSRCRHAPPALEAMTQRLVGYLEAHREKSFDDMCCYTLHVGRKVFPYRHIWSVAIRMRPLWS